jgi:hypothetical protein
MQQSEMHYLPLAPAYFSVLVGAVRDDPALAEPARMIRSFLERTRSTNRLASVSLNF